MMLTRRQILAAGGGGLVAFATPVPSMEKRGEVIAMKGTARGERVWFKPLGLAVAPETRIRFENQDAGNSHTATAYHPSLFGRSRRIPRKAAAWDSGFLLPGQGWEVTLDIPGVYDYYCLPHELAGMVGRIVVGSPADEGWLEPVEGADDLPDVARSVFPGIDAILMDRSIKSGGRT